MTRRPGKARSALLVGLRVWNAAPPSGIEPDHVWEAGGLISVVPGSRYKRSGWEIRSRLPVSSSLAEHLDDILLRTLPAENSDLPKGAEAVLGVGVYVGHPSPEMTLRPDQLRRLALIPASVWLDPYPWGWDDVSGTSSHVTFADAD